MTSLLDIVKNDFSNVLSSSVCFLAIDCILIVYIKRLNPGSFSVLQSWDVFFRNANAGAPPGSAYQSPPPVGVSLAGLAQAQSLVGAQPNVEKLVEDHLAVQSLIRAYQVHTDLKKTCSVVSLKILA